MNNNYIIDDNSADTFENLYRLIMSASVKDNDKIEEKRTNSWGFFSETLVKYYDERLEDGEIINLLKFVDEYNSATVKQLYATFYSNVLGLTNNISSTSLLGVIIDKLYAKAKKDNSDSKLTKEQLTDAVILYSIRFIQKHIKNTNTSEVLVINDDGEYVLKTIANQDYKLFDRIPLPETPYGELETWNIVEEGNHFVVKTNSETIYTSSNSLTDTEKTQEEYVTNIFKPDDSSFNKSPLLIAFEQHLIHIFKVDPYDSTKKIDASEKEISLATNRFPFSFIELHNVDISSLIDDTKSDYPYIKHVFTEEETGSERRYKTTASFVIKYKELNPVYREYEYCSCTDLAYSYLVNTADSNDSGEMFKAPTKFFSSISSYQNSCITDNIKNMLNVKYSEDSNYNYNEDPVHIIMNNIHTNAYLALAAPESDIIAYFAGDDEKYSFSYGDSKSEKEEINEFLETYDNVRNFYYNVLSSKAFTNYDDYYKCYEKTIIAIFSIVKTLDYKINNLKDIDKMNMTDINNFLESYGLGIVVKYKDFANQEEYKRQLLRYYNELMKAKGSKEVIDLLSKVFDVGNTDVDVKKHDLVSVVDNYDLTSSAEGIGEISVEYVDSDKSEYEGKITVTFNYFAYEKDMADVSTGTSKTIKKDIYFSKLENNKRSYYSDSGHHLFDIDETASRGDDIYNDLISNILDVVIAPEVGPYVISNMNDVESDKDGNVILSADVAKVLLNNDAKYGFVKLQYTSDDEFGAILNELDNLEDYESFILNDKYWSSEIAPLEDIKKLNINTIPTKYLSLDMTKDIDFTFIKSQYYLSVIRAIYNTFKNSNYDSSQIITPNKVNLEIEIDDLGSYTLSIATIFEMCLLLYNNLCELYRSLDNASRSANTISYGINTGIFGKDPDYFKSDLAGNLLNGDKIKELFIEKVLVLDTDPIFSHIKSDDTQETIKNILNHIRYQQFSDMSQLNISGNMKCKNSGQLVVDTLADVSSLLSLQSPGDLFRYLGYKIKGTRFDSDDKHFNNLSVDNDYFNNLSVDDYIIAIDNMIRFPIKYLNGEFIPEKDSSVNISKELTDWFDSLFNTFYINEKTDGNGYTDKSTDIFDILIPDNGKITIYAEPKDAKDAKYNDSSFGILSQKRELLEYIFGDIYDITYSDNDHILTKKDIFSSMTTANSKELILNVTKKTFNILSSIRTLFRSSEFVNWSFTNMETNSDEFSFLQAAVEIFISYTTNLYTVTFNRSYNSKFESVIPIDQFKFTNITVDLVDNVVVDDEFRI